MPYARNEDLPEQVKDHLPEHAQDIYRKTYNSAFDQYKNPEDRRGDASREEVAHKVAWSVVKSEYEKDDDGNWHRKDR